SYVKKSDVCIIPHHSNPHTESTIPHKIFQFMYLRKPILVSDVGPLKRVVDGTNSGLVFKAGDAIDLAQKINKILNSKEQWEAMGDNGRKAVQERYNWNMESRKLISLYDNLEKQQKS
ncbi:MAG: glycosyltransferase, partial [Thermoplasmata archaeon]|nr:glycosyltransferase [Thermoplasmata archaeon]